MPPPCVGQEQCRTVDAGECGRPGFLGFGRVPAVQQGQEVPVGPGPRQRRHVGVPGHIEREQFADRERHRPSVEEGVVVGPHEPRFPAAGRHEQEPHQGGPGRVERRGPVGDEDALQFGGPRGLRQAGEVEFAERYVDGRGHHLHERAVPRGHECHPQIRVPLQECRRGPAHPVRVDGALQVQFHLHRVGVDRRFREQCVEQQPGLQRGGRPHVGQRAEAFFPRVEVVLGDVDEGNVRGREPACDPAARVGHQGGQRLPPSCRQPLHLGAREQGVRETETDPEPSADHDRVDLDGGRRRHVRVRDVAEVAEPVGGGPAGRGVAGRRTRDLAEVVETDLPRFGVRQAARGVRVEVPEQSVADAHVRHRPEVFLHPLQRAAQVVAAGERVVEVDAAEFDADREDRGEPADGAGQVGARHHLLLPAVPFQSDQHRRSRDPPLGSPPRRRHHQRRQQNVEGAPVIQVR
ncbi:hypothetical protein Rhow_001308 [Rhodococcus wratislaviensis]|uniref:Uncharacterized protein n=1 Tax=Rhodococcus wratislaviensis TaxID=44752 RepID=A0A402CNL4_RHOWR|nr:hypothetical protein Rhow_001308 [Rhodococcus wratislaviensis]